MIVVILETPARGLSNDVTKKPFSHLLQSHLEAEKR
jgi:hypothetical protein